MNIKNKSLLINKCYVNGTWVSSDKKIKVINPASGDLIAEVPNFGKKEKNKNNQCAVLLELLVIKIFLKKF